ncbi:MAG TPA: DinB family protein [Tepidisphaeraceae bacterium]|nr:DinB family protein [Tepidisphaeraceae bacterium]
MTSKAAITKALKFGEQFCNALADMKDAPLERPCAGGNHAMWIAGHLAVVEGRLHKMLFGIPNPLEHWKPLFDWGSTPVDDASAYPPFEEVLTTLTNLRARTMAHLESLDDAELDAPIKVSSPHFPICDTVGNSLLIIALHQCGHAGEAFVIRRAAGKKPFFNPSPELRAF